MGCKGLLGHGKDQTLMPVRHLDGRRATAKLDAIIDAERAR
jgi:hypothetical protein